MALEDVLVHGLVWGMGLAAYLSAVVIGLLRLEPEMWVGDYPPDVREAFGPMSRRARRLRAWLGAPMMVGVLAIVTWATADLVSAYPSPGFVAVALHTFVLLMVFNVVDLVLIDWLFFVRLRPRFVVLPGTEGMAGYDDDAFHWRAFLKGTVGITAFSILMGLLVPLLPGVAP